MRLLSFDTSADLRLCLMENSQVVETKAEASAESRQTIASSLLPAIDSALKNAGWQKNSIDVLVVGIGPGSFTGIRSGIVTARTIGQALNLPVVGVSKLDCLSRVLEEELPAAVVLKAGTNRGIMHYFVAGYGKSDKGIIAEVEPCYLPAERLGTVLGEFNDWFGESDCRSLIEETDSQFIQLPEIENIAIIQAQIAQDRLSLSGLGDLSGSLSAEKRADMTKDFPFAKVAPLYLRGPSITLKTAK